MFTKAMNTKTTHPQEQPDILLLVLDTLRADRLSCYGYPRETTPHLDAFAEEGVLFERAISPAQWTIPAHASLFTGEYPTTHMTHQIHDKHTAALPTLAEHLRDAGYATVGFCNNPLLGIVENDLDRGFEEFYNYGGFFPERPPIGETRARWWGRLSHRLGRVLNRLNSPVQKALTTNNLLLKIALHPRIVPLWQRHINFRGNTRQSLGDMLGYLRTRQRKGRERPLFMFLNLMETHLPFGPPPRFVRRFVPYYRNNREARDFMGAYNEEHYRWMIPLAEPLTELQDRVINDMYAAEVGFEDHALRHIYAYLNEPEVRDNTLVIVTSDHGEGMNNHDFVGHSLVVYDDLVHVPLVMRYPRRYPAGKRISFPVSTRRIFHTALEAAGVQAEDGARAAGLSLARALEGEDPEQEAIYAEAYTPDTLIALMDNEDPEMLRRFRCRQMRRAAYQSAHKLIAVGGTPDELFDTEQDPGERVNLIATQPELAARLAARLDDFVADMEARRPGNGEAAKLDLEADPGLAERLRGLGYLQ
jgi:uncharacterized sulfatase